MKKKTKLKNKFKYFLLIISILILILLFSLFITFGVFYNRYELNINKLTSVNNGIRVYSFSGEDTTLYNTNRSIVEIETLPDYVIQAFIDVEDKRFYNHNGFDLKRIIKAGLVNFTTKSKSQGASTISQQLIKNALLSNEKTYSRKIQEIILAIKLEKQFSKQEIMEMYLNTIYFGSNAYGIENASKVYFNKSAKDLTLNEACCLAGLIKSPAYYSPKTNYENAIKRRNLVASLLLNNKHISQDDYDNLINEKIQISTKNELDHSYEEEAIFEACKLLNISERELINKNYQIITFKNDDLQKNIISANNEVITNAEENFNTNLDGVSIVVDKNNHVLAYYVNSNYNLHNMKRQPASILKPLAVYLPAISHNILSPADPILDEYINYKGFEPQNADKTFHGYVTAKDALSNSLNIPSVKILDCLGLKKSKEMLINLGINIEKEDLNLTLALGALKQGTKLFDIVSAYSSIANNGYYSHISFIDKILDENGNVVYCHDDYKEKVVDSESCFLLTDMLKQTSISGTAKRLESLNLPIASKTGTASNGINNTDLYNVAYTTEHTMLTWIANIKENKLPDEMLSSSQPTEINKKICKYLYPNGVKDFEIPEGVKKMSYDLIELENNHRVVKPNHNIERYIGYDYFKIENSPIEIQYDNTSLNLNVSIDKSGVSLSFQAQTNCSYNLYKKIENNLILLSTIKNSDDLYQQIDKDVFNYEEIEYFVKDEKDNLISEIYKIRPKDYLVNMLNNEILSGKNKWYI